MMQLLTPTGARPEAFALCQRWMLAQDYRAGEVRWIIVDDGEEPSSIGALLPNWHCVVVRPQPYWEPGVNTQARNIAAGLRYVNVDHPLAIIEDDDWYAPDWLTTVSRFLKMAEVVGEKHARYYNVATRRFSQLNNGNHASLCATAMRGDAAIGALRAACMSGTKFIDIDLWMHSKERQLFNGSRVVGIKGLPGRPGIGSGHGTEFGFRDENNVLRDWIGNDAEAYGR